MKNNWNIPLLTKIEVDGVKYGGVDYDGIIICMHKPCVRM